MQAGFSPLYITGAGALSAAASGLQQHLDFFAAPAPCFSALEGGAPAARLHPAAEAALESLQLPQRAFARADRSARLAAAAALQALGGAPPFPDLGVNIGSSRGATGVWEESYSGFATTGRTGPLASPLTTLGNVSSWAAQACMAQGMVISHSVTCSTGFQALANAAAWLQAGLADAFLAGAAEAPLTPFTLAQMQALGVYARPDAGESWPCRALGEKQRNTMILGEGAAVLLLQRSLLPGQRPLARLTGLGWANEAIPHPAGLAPGAPALRQAMQAALQRAGRSSVDVLIAHAPGTMEGDAGELAAANEAFGGALPYVASNKCYWGHSLGASAALGAVHALALLASAPPVQPPYPLLPGLAQQAPAQIRSVMVNAAGFGGNAGSFILEAV